MLKTELDRCQSVVQRQDRTISTLRNSIREDKDIIQRLQVWFLY